WIASLIALRRVTPRRIPQVMAATLYVLSPPAIAAVRTGRISSLVVIPLLPALVASVTAMVRPGTRQSLAWRASAAGALIGSVMIAFAPPVAALLLPGTLVVLLGLRWIVGDVEHRRGARLRLLAFLAGMLILLFPWSLDLLRAGSPVWNAVTPTGASPQPFWRLMVLVPQLEGFPGLLAGGGYLLAGVLGVALGLRTRTGMVVGLWSVGLSSALAAWFLGRAGDSAAAWPGLPLIFTAAAFAALFAVAFSEAGTSLGRHHVGWRHVLAGVSVLAVAAGIVTMTRHIGSDPWGNFVVGESSLPAFIGAEQESVGDFRVLVLTADGDDVRWDVTGAEGPSMLRYGQPVPPILAARIDRDLTDMMGGSDPGAAARLGLANIRWVVVPPRGISDAIDAALGQQLDLEPQPVRNGRVYLVSGWLPRAALVSREAVESVINEGALTPGMEVMPLTITDGAVHIPAGSAGAVLLAEADEGRWRATVDGREAEVGDIDGLVRLDLPDPVATDVTLAHDQSPRTALMALQLIGLLLGMSLVLRPPGFADARPGVTP
ncbi:MAG: MFS family permease, partial [Glaciecola sp.]